MLPRCIIIMMIILIVDVIIVVVIVIIILVIVVITLVIIIVIVVVIIIVIRSDLKLCAGMGDVVSLVEKLQTGVEEDEARLMGERMMANKFDFNDFLKQIRFMSKLGGLTGLVKMMPGAQACQPWVFWPKSAVCGSDKMCRAHVLALPPVCASCVASQCSVQGG